MINKEQISQQALRMFTETSIVTAEYFLMWIFTDKWPAFRLQLTTDML